MISINNYYRISQIGEVHSGVMLVSTQSTPIQGSDNQQSAINKSQGYLTHLIQMRTAISHLSSY